jgi:hypothetical protein
MIVQGCVINIGQKIDYDENGQVKIMAYGEGYFMLRRPHCRPFVKSVKELKEAGILKEFKL